MVKQRSFGPDSMDSGDDASSAFVDALRTRAMDDMLLAAQEYGIVLKDLGKQVSQRHTAPCLTRLLHCLPIAVINRQFKGEIASTMDKLTRRALQAQVEAAVRSLAIALVFPFHERLISDVYDRMWTGKTVTKSSKSKVLFRWRRSSPRLAM